ncbi:hypothetical protein ABQX22_10825 [Xanthomonas sp. WHRI 1810A]|uniref:hypothetical protein n=1 Tax=Xanthomonas sp. WHRI 1810A TaxID=3161565 RepID=UPI0032E8C920
MISNVHYLSSSTSVVNSSVDKAKPATGLLKQPATEVAGDSSELKISTLARQLGESAARAQIRDARFDRRELAAEASRLLNQIGGDAYHAQQNVHNAYVPKTDDPDLLDRASLATEYVVRRAQQDQSVKNPFGGLSREQLNLIVYDESGSYTVNERRAASYAISGMESRWREALFRDKNIESATNGGKTPNFYAEIAAHYRSLPLIEQVEYPDDYEAKALADMRDEKSPLQQKEPKFMTLFEMMELMFRRKKFDHAPATVESAGIAGAMSKVNAASSRSTAGLP